MKGLKGMDVGPVFRTKPTQKKRLHLHREINEKEPSDESTKDLQGLTPPGPKWKQDGFGHVFVSCGYRKHAAEIPNLKYGK